MLFFTVVGLAVALFLAHVWFKVFARPSLSVIRGPQSPSFIIGNLLELLQRPVGEADFAWHRQYGNVVRFKSVFGEDRLFVTDPKALQKILNTSAYSYSRLPNLRAISQLFTGKGLLCAEGEDHRRQRSIMLAGFGLKESRAFTPVFKDCAEAISVKWADAIGSAHDSHTVIDVLEWVSRGALDAIGHAAFDIQFDAIPDNPHPLAKQYRNLFSDFFGRPSAMQIFVQASSKHIPTSVYQWILKNAPVTRLARARDANNMTTRAAKELVREKTKSLSAGEANNDIFTLLINANINANAKMKLSDGELLAQMRTLLVAGHETTANAMAWILLELARHPKVQSRLRDEIRLTEALAHGNSRLDGQESETMPYLNAVIKEGLRLHPPVPLSTRLALQDDVLSISKPILTQSGDWISEVHVRKGTEIVVSIAAYNRDQDIWGDDAHEFRPERWLDGKMGASKLPSIGMYSHLLTFLSGARGCIGWRLAVMEIQAFLSTLVGKFEFGMTDKARRIIRSPSLVMVPMVEDEVDNGRIQVPLSVSLAFDDPESQ